MPKKNKLTVHYTDRSVVEDRLLVALENDDTKVAILASQEDVQMLIDGLKELDTPQAKEFCGDLTVLRDRSFL